MSLAELCTTYGLDATAMVAALKPHGIAAAPTDDLRAVADRHGLGPVVLYGLIKTTADTL